MARPAGNTRLKAARQAAGYGSHQKLAAALNQAARQLGFHLDISERQVRRWESATPPWPHDSAQRALLHVLHLPMEDLGFTPPWELGDPRSSVRRAATPAVPSIGAPAALPLPVASAPGRQPASVAADFALVTAAHRRLYWTVQPTHLHPTVSEHARLGTALLAETAGLPRIVLARALAETNLLCGRIEFFDLRKPDSAADTYVRALQAAGEADDPLLGAAILAHGAFIPGWAGEREAMTERIAAARAMARRGPASAALLAWLDCVEAECETRSGNTRAALNLLGHAEDVLAAGGAHPSPAWLDWFAPVRLAAFKGNTQLKAGHIPQARETLTSVLDQLPPESGKQRVVILADLAAVEAAAQQPEQACALAQQALEQLAATWYEMGMDRIRETRRALRAWDDTECVRALDDALYGWTVTVSALQR